MEAEVQEAVTGWRAGCSVCRGMPTRWKIELPEPDQRGRLTAHFCERHERNKDMLVAQLCASNEPFLTA